MPAGGARVSLEQEDFKLHVTEGFRAVGLVNVYHTEAFSLDSVFCVAGRLTSRKDGEDSGSLLRFIKTTSLSFVGL